MSMIPEQYSKPTVGTTLVGNGLPIIFLIAVVFPTPDSPTTKTVIAIFLLLKLSSICSQYKRNILIILFMKVWLLLLALTYLSTSLQCEAYILELTNLYNTNKTAFSTEVAPFALSSGKIADDLGFPGICVRKSEQSYFTVEIKAPGIENQYTVYLGMCFSSKCSEQQMANNGATIINTLLNITVFNNETAIFYQPKLQAQFSASAIVVLVLLIIFVLLSFKDGIESMVKGCVKQTRQTKQESNQYQIKFTEDYDPTHLVLERKQGFFKQNNIFQKLEMYFVPQETNKIIAFSSVRILVTPLAFYGYLFYLCNYGSTNYFAFNKEIYGQTFSDIALASYYIPDVLFFISGFIFAKKGFQIIEVEKRPITPLLQMLGRKMKRLYPLYLLIIVIYWLVSPSLHAGPVWYQYQKQAAQCNSGWWRSIIPIDNWFQNGCYNFGWFIPAQIQLVLVNIVILLAVAKNKKAGLALLAVAFIVSWILDFTISSPLPSSLETTLDYSAEKYFKSTYSHLPFYLLGSVNAYLSINSKTKHILSGLTENAILKFIALILGTIIILLVVLRPSIWDQVLGFQLGLARTGFFVGIYLFMFWGMFSEKVQKTYIHKLSELNLGVLLMGGIIIGSCFWSKESFPYLDGQYLLETTVTNYFIALLVGGFLSALVWAKPKKEQMIIL